MANFTMRENDTLPIIGATLSDPNGIIDLTGASVAFHMNVAKGGTPKVNAAASIVGDPTLGVVEYAWIAIDTDSPGTYNCEWEVTFANGKILSCPNDSYDTVTILADLESELD
jgi:hypothetical protein